MSYDNNMTGALFANDKRQKDTDPNAKGSCEIDGVEYWVNAWTNTSKAGQKYQSLKFTRKDARSEQPQQQAPQGGGTVEDDIPFAQFMKGSI